MAERTRSDQVRDIVMGLTLILWVTFGVAAAVQLFTSGAKALDSLPPFWFWTLPVAPWTAMYAPWRQILPGGTTQQPEPPPPAPPANPTPESTP